MTTRAQVIEAAKECDAYRYINRAAKDEPTHTFTIEKLERFYTIAYNAGYRSFCDETCPTCGQTRQHAGGGCIHCITEWCKERVKAAGAKNKQLEAENAQLSTDFAELRSKVFTNGDRSMTMDGRTFTVEGDGLIFDNSFDFDATLRVSGDFVDDQKRQYSEMIVEVLNATPAQSLARHNNAIMEKCAIGCEVEAERWRGTQDISDFRLCAALIRAMKEPE